MSLELTDGEYVIVSGQRTDVAIIGGGVIGSAIAYFLTADPAFSGRVTVFERDPTYRKASSALSASSIRQQFSTAENIRISQFGIEFLRALDQHLEVNGEVPEIGLHEGGYLYLATEAGAAILQEVNALQRAEGADIALMTPEALHQRFPWLSVEDVALGSLGLSGEGWFDGYGLMQAFRRKARAQGAVYVQGEVVALDRQSARVEVLTLADGTVWSAGAIVNAAGPYARQIAEMAGLSLPVEARKRCVFVLDCKTPLPGCPLLIDPSGFWVRPEGQYFLTGAPPLNDPEDFDLDNIDHALFEEVMWPALATRIPAFEALKVVNAWAGHYEYNTFDHNAILGRFPEVENLYCANGFSGHGLQQAPAVGRGLAELIAHGRYSSLDLSVFSPERLLSRRPIVERNVI